MQVAQEAQEVNDDGNQDDNRGEHELNDDEIDRLLESANEETDYLQARKAERAYHFKQQSCEYVRTMQASRKLFPIAKKVGKTLSFKD